MHVNIKEYDVEMNENMKTQRLQQDVINIKYVLSNHFTLW